MALIDKYSKEELEQIVKQSNSWRDLSKRLGYNCNSSDLKNVLQKRITQYQIDTSHFTIVAPNTIKRTRENVFVENSTADQSVLRRFYSKEPIEYKCSICGQLPIWNNKELTLILDHINGDNHDDRLENLRWVCPNCNIQLPTTNRRKDSLTKKYYCIDCGAEVSTKNTLRCRVCQAKHQTISLNELPITRDKLKELIRTTPFTQIGKQFSISDNMVRKWCDKFSLPRKVSEIQQYTDEEWSKI